MDFCQLEYFVAVAEERHFTRGAQRANVVQSTASAAITRLEREFGVRLFDRGRNGAQLTAAGQVLLRRAHVLLGEAERTRDELQLGVGGLHGVVTLGTVLSTGDFDLVAALLAFRLARPDVAVHLRLSGGPLDDRINEVLDGHVHLLLLPVPSRRRPGIQIDRVTTMRLALHVRRPTPSPGAGPSPTARSPTAGSSTFRRTGGTVLSSMASSPPNMSSDMSTSRSSTWPPRFA